jgi:hypothetical protein
MIASIATMASIASIISHYWRGPRCTTPDAAPKSVQSARSCETSQTDGRHTTAVGAWCMKSLRSEWNYSVTLCMLQGYWKVMLCTRCD